MPTPFQAQALANLYDSQSQLDSAIQAATDPKVINFLSLSLAKIKLDISAINGQIIASDTAGMATAAAALSTSKAQLDSVLSSVNTAATIIGAVNSLVQTASSFIAAAALA